MLPQHPAVNVLKNVIIYKIFCLVIFYLIFILFYFIIITDVIVIFWDVMFGSLMEMNQLIFFILNLLNLFNMLMWQMVLSPGQMLLTNYNIYVGQMLCH